MTRLDENKLQALQKAHEKGIVVGLKDVADIVPRLDIDVLLVQKPQTFNLFILAFDKLQRESSSTEKMGYFQIAGIHGAPKTSWDGMGPKQNANATIINPVASGYCAHATETFPTWHRPYLAMLEQTIFLKMVDIAKDYDAPYRTQYLDAALDFRLPYWDYFRPRGGPVEFPGVIDKGSTKFPYDYSLPRIFTEQTVSVRYPPNNELRSLSRNPFQFHEFINDESSKIEWQVFAGDTKLFPRDRTARYITPGSEEIQEDVTTMNRVLNELRMDSNRLVLQMLENKAYNRYDVFACNRYKIPTVTPPSGSTKEATEFVYGWPSGSIEALHGAYHVIVGGSPFPAKKIPGGHMSRVAIAAFDPVFWMHHGQIERLFSLWQAIHKGEKGSWFSNPKQAEADLQPFRKLNEKNDPNICWNSNDAESTETFGYTYSEIKEGGDVWMRVNNLYKWSIPLTDAGKLGPIPHEMEYSDLDQSEFFADPAKAPVFKSSLLSSMQKITTQQVQAVLQPERHITTPTSEINFSREWYIDDKVKRMALNGAFTIFYFVNDSSAPIPADSNYILEPTLAGITHIFAAPENLCDNCGRQDQQGTLVTNTVPITSLLLDYVKEGRLESLRPEHVKPFLIRGLKWRVVSVNAESKDPREMKDEKSFEVGVSCKKARLPRDSGDVTYEEYPEIFQDIIAHASPTPTTSTGPERGAEGL